jgi:hypothetical protein
MVFNNEGQESCVLLGNPEWGQKMTPLVVQVKGKDGVVGSKVRVLDKDGKLQGSHVVFAHLVCPVYVFDVDDDGTPTSSHISVELVHQTLARGAPLDYFVASLS